MQFSPSVNRSKRPFKWQSRWQKIFFAICVLLLAQVVWWTAAFFNQVSTIASLKIKDATQHQAESSNGNASEPGRVNEIVHEAYRQRIMFLSEATFFLMAGCFGMYLLFYAMRAEARAQEIQQNFVEIVSHEARTPLTALKLRLESMLESRKDDVDLCKEVRLASTEMKRLVSLFEKALSLNRLERQALQFEEIHPADLVSEVVRRMEPLFNEKSTRVSLNLDHDTVVKADSFALQNLVQSLLENGVFYNDKKHGEIEVSVKNRGKWAVISVVDNGPGIKDEDRNRIFEKFYRGESSGKVPGSGLGLYLARGLAEAHGGSLECNRALESSGASHTGSCFEVLIPQVDAV